MKIYLSVMVTLGALLLLVLLVQVVIITTRFLRERMLEEQRRHYKKFREAVDFEDPMKLEFYLVEYHNSIYDEDARFELGEKYFHHKRYRLARDAYQKLIRLYPKGIHVEVAMQRLKMAEQQLKEHPEMTKPAFLSRRDVETI